VAGQSARWAIRAFFGFLLPVPPSLGARPVPHGSRKDREPDPAGTDQARGTRCRG